ncbi:MAG: YdaU family protein [Rhodospirillaceae bacterium]
MTETPWIKFYPSDWLAGTRSLSPTETGLYITLIAMMYEAGGALPRDDARLSRLCGCAKGTFKKALETLIAMGKVSHQDGVLRNDRVEAEIKKRQDISAHRTQAAKARWTAERKKSQRNQGVLPALGLQEDEQVSSKSPASPKARVQSSNKTAVLFSAGSPDGGAAPAPAPNHPPTHTPPQTAKAGDDPEDLKAQIFGPCLRWLSAKTGSSDRATRALVGKWLAQHGDGPVLEALQAAARERPLDPVPWITKALKARSSPSSPRTGGSHDTARSQNKQHRSAADKEADRRDRALATVEGLLDAKGLGLRR